MAAHDYHFVTHWRIAGTAAELYDVLADADGLKRWWPSVYLDARVLESGDEHGIGRVVDLYTKGWLPYTLRWRFRITDAERPRGLSLQANGDFVGRGVWTFVEDGPYVDVTYDWSIRAEKPFLRAMSWLLKPVFALNHRWAMWQGYLSLLLELRRRRAVTEHERRMVPPPPGPTFAPSSGATLTPGWADRPRAS